MPSEEREAIVWCPRCRVAKYEIWRVPAENEGVYRNEPRPADKVAKTCECGKNLERKP